MKRIQGVLLVSLAFALTGCFPSFQPTPEQAKMRQELMQKILDRVNNQQTTRQPVVQSQAPTFTASVTEADIGAKIESFPAVETGAVFIKKKDGFEVNNTRYVDPEGTIVKYGYDSRTGDVTYVAEAQPDSFVIKTVRVNTNTEPVTIATAQRSQSDWTVMTVTGKKLSGDSVIPLARGILVTRTSAGFIYTPGKGINNFGVPDGFTIAAFQNGNIGKTRFVLLEREALDKNNQLGGLLSSVQSLGSGLGINKKEDYMLLNVDNGQKVPINVSIDDKDIASHSGCRKKNAVINACARVDFYESLFDQYGKPNTGHYFWRIAWIATDSGPMLITNENGLGELKITSLNTGKSIVAFKRLLGINYFSVDEKPDGRYSLTARLGFSDESIPDIEQFVNNSPSMQANSVQ